jgi:hypothetical protein
MPLDWIISSAARPDWYEEIWTEPSTTSAAPSNDGQERTLRRLPMWAAPVPNPTRASLELANADRARAHKLDPDSY